MNNNKNILFMFRLYDGFYNSLKDRAWKPTGVPAISNLLERITKENGINSLIYFIYLIDKTILKKPKNLHKRIKFICSYISFTFFLLK